MASESLLTKYIDGAGIKALYNFIKTQVTTGAWGAGSSDNATNAEYISVIESTTLFNDGGQSITDKPAGNITKLWLPGYAESGNDIKYKQLLSTSRTWIDITEATSGWGDGTTTIYKDTLHTDYLSLSGRSVSSGSSVLLGTGEEKLISDLEVKSATQIKSALSTSSSNPTYYLLGSKSSAADTSTSLKHANVSVTVGSDSKAILKADGFNGPLKTTTHIAGGSAASTQYPLLTKNGSISANGTPYITPEAFGSVYITKQSDQEVIVAPKFVGALEGNAKTATSATNATNATNAGKADTLKVPAPSNTDTTKLYLWNSAGDTETYTTPVRRTGIYVNAVKGGLGDTLNVPRINLTASIMNYEDNEVVPYKTIRTYVENQISTGISSVIKIKGSVSAWSGLPDGTSTKPVEVGYAYIVTASFTNGGSQYDPGDMIVCTAVAASTKAPTWTTIQRNIPEALTTSEVETLLDDAEQGR